MVPQVKYPFDFVHRNAGCGAYTGVIHLGPFTSVPIGSVLLDLSWLGTQKSMVVTGYGVEINVETAPAAGAYIHMGLRKYHGMTARPTGGVVTTELGGRKRGIMPPMSEVYNYLEVRRRGTAPVSAIVPAAGTRENPFVSVDAYGDKKGIARAASIVDLDMANANPVFLEDGEGIEMFTADAVAADTTFSCHFILRFLLLDKKTMAEHFGG